MDSVDKLTKKERDAKRYLQNKDVIKARNAAYKDANHEEVKAKNAIYLRKRRASNKDPAFKERERQRRVFRRLLDPRVILNAEIIKMASWLGCSIAQFRTHIKNQFEPEWGFHNHGKVWVIDHIKPLIQFDVLDEAQCKEAWHYTNLRPFDKTENTIKGNTSDRVQ